MKKLFCTAILSALMLTACNSTESNTDEIYSEETTYITAEVKDVLSADMTGYASPDIHTLQSSPSRTYTEREITMLAKTVWREAGACEPSEQRLIVWTVFQRIDSTAHDFEDMNTVSETLTAGGQFAYDPDAPVYEDILALCREEAEKWTDGQPPPTLEPYAPTAPYLFYTGDGEHNWFRAEWQ
ncbi:MAG: hypothetical protein NC253_15635 [Ruminococcus sp.]|nr:hypothetical protein [Ruminococcus sp.]MCM1380588.1 hypothetical protein [Muribaculaceae bacterium]MCM1479771.1 hypothetical protein [Muribaculaceae bacterium]